MRVNKKHKFIYVSTPKACTHTIYKILNQHYSSELIKVGFHNNQIPNKYKDFFRWTIVRNPFTRAVSIWWSTCRLAHKDQYGFRGKSGGQYDFSKFIKWMVYKVNDKERQQQPLLQNQISWLAPAQPITFIKLEKLKGGLGQLPFWKKGIKIPKLNTTKQKIKTQSEIENKKIKKPTMKELYSGDTVEAVLKWAMPDFEIFGYRKCPM